MPDRPHTHIGQRLRLSRAGDPPADRQHLRLRLLAAGLTLSAVAMLTAAWATITFTAASTGATAVAAGLGCCVVLLVGDHRAQALTKAAREGADRTMEEEHEKLLEWLQHYRALIGQGLKSLTSTLEQIERGETPDPPILNQKDPGDNPCDLVACEIRRSYVEAAQEVIAAAVRSQAASEAAGLADVFLYLARRLLTVNARALAALSALEATTEDPDVNTALYAIDHLVVLERRSAESLAVLGGETARRVKDALSLSTVLRQGAAEVFDFRRVTIDWPREELWVSGDAGPDLSHLLAEFIENGTKFSSPENKVVMRTVKVRAGLVIEIDDRGELPMSPEKLAEMNHVLDASFDVDPREWMREHGLGLLVAGRIVRRLGLRAELQPNIYGGTRAVIALPNELFTTPPQPTTRLGGPSRSPKTEPGTGTPRRPAEIGTPLSRTELPQLATPTGPDALPQRRRRSPLPAETAPGSESRPQLPKRARHEGGPPPLTPASRSADSPSPDFAAGFMTGTRDGLAPPTVPPSDG